MHLLLIAVAVLASAPLAAAAQPSPAKDDSALVNEARRLIMARVTSSAGGDTAAFRRLIVPGFVHVYDGGWRQSGPALLRQMASDRTGAAYAKAGQFTVTEVHARRVGPMLLIDNVVTLRFNPGADTAISTRWRETNALVRVGGQWRFAQHSETPILELAGHPITAALPDSAALGAFVGDYEWPGGDIDHITQRGARLYGQDGKDPNGPPPHPWVAAGAEAFYPEGDAAGLTVFARDSTGRVTHAIGRITGGPLLVARKIR
jgi:hypothetical protein